MGGGAGFKLYVHAYCPSSYRVVKHLADKGLVEKFELIPLNPDNPVFLATSIPSVPALAIGGRLVAVDPLEPQFVEGLATGGSIREFIPLSDVEVVERFINSVKASSYLMIHLALGGLSIEEVLSTNFPEVAARVYFSGLSGSYVREVILSRMGTLAEALASSYLRSVAYSYVRDVAISSGTLSRDLLDLKYLKLWLTAKLSQGIAFTPLMEGHLEQAEVRLREVLAYLLEKYEVIAGYFEKYITELRSNPELYKLLTKGNRKT